jgi:hypothetical protein
MRFKTIAKLVVASMVILTGSPALATQITCHEAHSCSCEQKTGACRHRTFGTCVARESCAPHWNGEDTTHDDWPADMILG